METTVPPPKRGRPKKTRISPEGCREKIKATYIIKRLQDHIAGTIQMSISQVKACDVLLRKIVPDVHTTAIIGELTTRYVVEVPPLMTREEWIERYSPKQISNEQISNGANGQSQ